MAPRRTTGTDKKKTGGTNAEKVLGGSAGAAGCTFCEVAARRVGATIVFEDEISVAFLDHRPLFPGHLLLITRQHFETLLDLPRELVGPLFLNAQMLTGAVQEAMEAPGSFVAINNVVSQSVPHFHLHIVPRRRGDGLRGFFWPRTKYGSAEQMAGIQRALEAKTKRGR